MRGGTKIYLEKPQGEGAWELVEDSGEPLRVAAWPDRGLRDWLLRGFWGPAPECRKGIPKKASRRLRRRFVEKTDFFEHEELASVELADLLRALDKPTESLEPFSDWAREELLPAIRRAGFAETATLRLILATG